MCVLRCDVLTVALQLGASDFHTKCFIHILLMYPVREGMNSQDSGSVVFVFFCKPETSSVLVTQVNN